MTMLARRRMMTPRAIRPRTTPVAGILVVAMFMLTRRAVMAARPIHLRIAVPTPRITRTICRHGKHQRQGDAHGKNQIPHSYASIPRTSFARPPPRRRKKRVACLHIDVLFEARPSALGKQRIKDTPRGYHVAHLTYPAFLEDWSFSNKAKYARLRTCLGPFGTPRPLSSPGRDAPVTYEVLPFPRDATSRRVYELGRWLTPVPSTEVKDQNRVERRMGDCARSPPKNVIILPHSACDGQWANGHNELLSPHHGVSIPALPRPIDEHHVHTEPKVLAELRRFPQEDHHTVQWSS